jgi:hypothetical protein
MNTAPRQKTTGLRAPRPEVRLAVTNVLTKSPAFAQLPAATRQQVARDTALVADYLAAPEGIEGQKIPGGVGMPWAKAPEGEGTNPPQQASYEQTPNAVSEIAPSQFKAGAAREGAEVARLFLEKVNFVAFVSRLIEGVFHAIVKSSIEQMEAYSKMIAVVAQSLQPFRDDNITENQGRDHMVEKFPDMFEIGVDEFADDPQPRLKLRDGVDEGDALKRVNSTINFEGGPLKSMDLSDADVEKALVTGTRTQLARHRQQLMASLVLMGINRIVVTDGKISAKVMYDFQARDKGSIGRSAAAYDYAHNPDRTLATTRSGEGQYEGGRTGQYSSSSGGVNSSAESNAKGTYKFDDKPVLTAMNAASEVSDAALQTRAKLAGDVEVNFKSDYLPLDKMATPGMILPIEGNSTPVDPNVMPATRCPQTPAQSGGAQPAQQTQQTLAPAGRPSNGRLGEAP